MSTLFLYHWFPAAEEDSIITKPPPVVQVTRGPVAVNVGIAGTGLITKSVAVRQPGSVEHSDQNEYVPGVKELIKAG